MDDTNSKSNRRSFQIEDPYTTLINQIEDIVPKQIQSLNASPLPGMFLTLLDPCFTVYLLFDFFWQPFPKSFQIEDAL